MHLSLPLRRFVASLWFLVYAAFTVLGGALVRCQEADGSVSVEWRGSGCCVPKAPVGAGDVGGLSRTSPTEADCDGCRDQAFTDTMSATAPHGSATASVKAADVPAPPAALLVVARAMVFESPAHSARQMRAPHPPPRLAAIRTVVLRV